MKTALVLVSSIALSCVPASDEEPPAGAAGFVTEPSPATRGEPITTDDGWVLRVERVTLSAQVTTNPASGNYDGRRFGGGGWLFDAAQPSVLYAPHVSVGGAAVSLGLLGNYIYIGREGSRDRRRLLNVDPEVVDRFNRPPDEGFEDYYGGQYEKYPSGYGPSIAIVARAERGGRLERMELALGVTTYATGTSSRGIVMDVKEDAVATRPLGVRAEELFRDGKGRFVFDEFASADRDRDGVITIAELLATTTTCNCPVTATAHGTTPAPKPDLVDLLQLNAGKIFVVR